MVKTYNQTLADAYAQLGTGTREKPSEIFPKFAKKDFQQLKDDYNAQYGYTVRIPQWDDVVHLVPNALKSEAVIKAEKKEALTRILESPAPEWFRTYATAATWIDNIQDHASVLYPLLKLLSKVAPRAFQKLTPVIGWIATGFDALNMLNALGRAKITGLKAKREVCKYHKQNLFGKVSRYQRVDNIRNWKPNWADAIQALQVSDQYTGFGLSMGGIMGAVTDSIFAAYRYATGEPVRFSFDPPDPATLTDLGSRAFTAAAAISSQGQTFTDFQHFWTYMTAWMATVGCAGTFQELRLAELVEDPMNILLPAPEPTDPLTIAVIKDMGLRVQDGIGWPFNGEKFITLGDLTDATAEPCRANFVDYCRRHRKDAYGWCAVAAMDSLVPMNILAVNPDATHFEDDTTEMKVFWKMVKGAVLPEKGFTEEQANDLFSWANAYTDLYEKTPGILELEDKMTSLGIRFKTSYPAEPTPDFLELWPEGWVGEEPL